MVETQKLKQAIEELGFDVTHIQETDFIKLTDLQKFIEVMAQPHVIKDIMFAYTFGKSVDLKKYFNIPLTGPKNP